MKSVRLVAVMSHEVIVVLGIWWQRLSQYRHRDAIHLR